MAHPSALDALERLREGNRRFVDGSSTTEWLGPSGRPTSRPDGRRPAVEQEPFAIVLGCSDSRVPLEIVFDQGIGDLFVIRVAGNIVAPSQVGSVEFAALQFGTRLVVVLGHTSCGAVAGTLHELQRPSENRSPNLDSIVDRIRPAVRPLLGSGPGGDPSELLGRAVRANVRASADQLRQGSSVLEALIEQDGLLVVGAEYSLETGIVDFFDGVPGR